MRGDRTRGFSLIETLMAASILAFGLVGSAAWVVSSMALCREARDVDVAAADLAAAADRIQGTPFPSLVATFADGSTMPAPSGGWQLSGEQIAVKYFTNGAPGAPGSSDVATEVRLTVTWRDARNQTTGQTNPFLTLPVAKVR